MVFFSELLEKKKRNDVLLTGYNELDTELASLRNSSGLTASSPQTQRSHPTKTDSLHSGVPLRSASEISGPTGSGKTAIWLSLVLDALKQGFRVLYIGCNYSQFPFSRAQQLDGWNHDRYKSRIDCFYLDQIDQLFVFDTDGVDYNLIIVDRYDYLIPDIWSYQKRIRAYNAVSTKVEDMASHSCIVVTCGAIKHYTIQQDSVLMAPASHIKTRKDQILPIMLYKNPPNNCALYSGLSFLVDTRYGIVSPLTSGVQVPLLSQSNTKTPLSQSKGAYTPSSSSVKRRTSFSTPSKLRKSEQTWARGRGTDVIGDLDDKPGSPSRRNHNLLHNTPHNFSTPTHSMHDITRSLRSVPMPSPIQHIATSVAPLSAPSSPVPSHTQPSSILSATPTQPSIPFSKQAPPSDSLSHPERASPERASPDRASPSPANSTPVQPHMQIPSSVQASSHNVGVSSSYSLNDISPIKADPEEVENSQIEFNDRDFSIAG